jgi:adenylate kinase family enzyme
MGSKNYLIEGVSGTGKTSVAEELQRRGYQVLHGDRELSLRGDPLTGLPLQEPAPEALREDPVWVHEHHIWDENKVRMLAADRRNPVSFFCGGARNVPRFIALFDEVFVLEIDRDTLNRRLDARPEDEFGGRPDERALILRLHETKADMPVGGVAIDATAPLDRVVDAILARCGAGAETPV